MEQSPFCERDFILPNELETYDKKGDFLIKIKKEGMIHEVVYATHPFDVVGWDGYNFPYGFSIHNFEPITGRVHQPPPVHQTFQGDGFVICSFCPRPYDFHPEAIPAPYNHSNINSDEVIYYVAGNFMSRRGVDISSFTIHPAGIPHGPHPGSVEASIGKEATEELAVMIDTFHPLHLTRQASELEDDRYRIAFAGNGQTSLEAVQNYLMYRAAELTLESGRDYFLLVGTSTQGEQGRSPGVGVSVGGFRFGGSGGLGIGIGTSTGGDRKAYRAQADILLRAGTKPLDDPQAFDARELKANLEAQISRPQP